MAVAAVLLILSPACSQSDCVENSDDGIFQLSPSGRATAYMDSSAFDSAFTWLQQVDRHVSFNCLVERFSASFANDFDVLVMVLDIPSDEFLATSSTRSIANFTSAQRIFERGLGEVRRPIFNPVGPPSMRSYTVLGASDTLVAGPLLHELAHSWAAYLTGPPSLAAQLETEPLSHWGFTSVGGALGGWDPDTLVDLGAGVYRACGPTGLEVFSPAGYAGNSVPYAPLELYLMGLVPPEEVPPIEVAVNPVLEVLRGDCADFSAERIELVTIEDIITANGARFPAADASPRHLELAVMIITDHLLTDEEWSTYEEALACADGSAECPTITPIGASGFPPTFTPLTFEDATGGRATLSFVELESREPPTSLSEFLESENQQKSPQ